MDGFLENFEIDKVVVLATDVKLIFQQSEINTTPSTATDIIVRGTKEYHILSVGQDPAAAIYTLQLRAA